MSETPEIHALLGQAPWIRALARSLVQDPNTADDLVQETWVSVLEHEPDTSRSLHGWVSTVLRNHLGKLRRGEGHRRGRELAVSRPESEPAVSDVVERASTHKNLVEAVLALDEPYRQTILLRYFEQLSYEEIAERMSVAKATVNSRLTRGLARLRERLDREYGGEKNLLAALVPICTAVRPEVAVAAATATATGATSLMSTPFQLSMAAALSVAGIATVWQFSSSATPTTLAAHTPSDPGTGHPGMSTAGLAIPMPRERGAIEPVHQNQNARGLALETGLDDDDWVADVSHELNIGRDVEALHLNSGAGDIEVLEGANGVVSIDAKVSVNPDDVPSGKLTWNFEDHVTIEQEDGVLTIKDRHSSNDEDEDDDAQWNVSLVVRVPAGLSLAANSGAGDVVVRTVSSDVALNSGAGDVQVLARSGNAKAIRANSGAGDVTIEIGSVQGDLTANSGAGDVEVNLSRGTPAGGMQLSSGAGSIKLAASGDLIGKFKIESGVGDIFVPASWGFEIRSKGKVGKRATGELGSGGPKHSLSSGVGNVTIDVASVY